MGVSVVFKFNHALCALAALSISSAASATSYDLVGNFGASVFAYGAGSYSNGALTFDAFVNGYTNCFNVSGFDCTTSGPAGDTSGSSNLPGIGATQGGANFLTVNVPGNELWAHPAQGSGDTDAMIRFTAQQTGFYTLAGLFQRLDTMTSGSNDPGNNGVAVAIYKSGVDGISTVFSSSALQGYGVTQNSQAGYSDSVFLNAGDSLFWAINNNGNYYNDSTGITGTIGLRGNDVVLSVPEPASWAMMVVGFGLAGLGLRSTRRAKVHFA